MKKVQKELQILKKEEQKLTNKKIKLELDTSKYQKELENIKLNTDKELQNAQTEVQVDFVLNAEQLQVEQLNQKYSKQFQELKSINNELTTNKSKQEDIAKSIDKINDKLSKTKKIDAINNSIDGINKSITQTIKKVGKWALAVFGIRSAYMAVRNAASTLAQYNEQISTDLEYIKFALASALQPVVEKIISLVYTLLSYINMIAKAWFNVDLFANASAKSMKNAAKSAKATSKSLAGFDEINQLQDNNSESENNISTPSVNLDEISNMNVPSWLQWIMDNKDIILSFVFGLGVALTALKLSNVAAGLGLIAKGIGAIKALGIGALIAGVLITILGIIDYLKDPSWENFIVILGGIALAVTGVAILFGGIPALITAIIAIVGALGLAIYKHWDDIKKVLSKVGTWINENIIKPVASFFTGLWNGMINGITNAISKIKENFKSIVNFFKNIISTIVNLFKTIGTKVGNVIGNAFKLVINGILSAIENILNFPIKSVNKLLDVINDVPGINIKKLETFKLPRLASGGIVDVPKTGVNIGGAIAGEAGAEGVLPLTNAETMSRLGQEIGKWITLNIDLTNSIDGRVLNKRLETIRKENSFARNGG